METGINQELLPEAEGKIWYQHPVWFLNENPALGYNIQKAVVRLMFGSGADFGEENSNLAQVNSKMLLYSTQPQTGVKAIFYPGQCTGFSITQCPNMH